jgi:uncharacterized protein
MISHERLKEVMLDQKELFSRKKELIDRDIELDQYIGTKMVVIISGIRRCGKSSLLFLIKENMKLAEQAFCYFNFDDERVIPDRDLLDQIYNLHLELFGQEPVFFLDEIQQVPYWERFVNRMYEQGLKLFVTGSNGALLSSEISTSLTGRNKLLELFPFSFREYLRWLHHEYHIIRLTPKSKSLLIRDFNAYYETGGFPLVVIEHDLELINGYFQDIFYRDIVSRYRLSQVNELKHIGLYFASNISKKFSYTTLQEISGVKSLSSIHDYLHYYEQSYLFFYLKKFDFSLKKQIRNPRKVYTIDQAFAHRLGFHFSEDRGRILENIVFMELLRRGKQVYYHMGDHECDFLVKKGILITEAIQVAFSLNRNNMKREIQGLEEAINLYHPGSALLLVYTMDPNVVLEHPTIRMIPVWQWLLE